MRKNMKCLVKTLHLLSDSLRLGAATGVVLPQCMKGWLEDGQLMVALKPGANGLPAEEGRCGRKSD